MDYTCSFSYFNVVSQIKNINGNLKFKVYSWCEKKTNSKWMFEGKQRGFKGLIVFVYFDFFTGPFETGMWIICFDIPLLHV